ncbi:MAG: transporter substrate-binding domain-containing protein [Atribacterota bacterium]
MLVVLALLALELKNLLSSVIVLGAFSLVLSLVLYYLHAPDVAITEAAIGSGFATVIFIIAIKKRGSLIMLTYPHSRFFFYDYQGEPSGLDYDILSLFAQKLDMELEVREVGKWDELIAQLVSERGDIIGAGMTRLEEREKQISFSDGYFPTRVVIVTNTDNTELNSISDLKDKTVFSVPNTSCYHALKLVDGIKIDTSFSNPDKLLKAVSEGEVYAVAVDMIEAMVGQIGYHNLKVVGTISNIQEYGYGIAKDREELLIQLNEFLKEIKNNGTYNKLYKKYIH